MDWNNILNVLWSIAQWLIPAGGLVTITGWFLNKTERELKALRDEHDTYKLLYQDTKNALEEYVKETRSLRTVVARFERAFSKMATCRHYDSCPINVELRDQQTEQLAPTNRQRQPRRSGNNTAECGDDTPTGGRDSPIG